MSHKSVRREVMPGPSSSSESTATVRRSARISSLRSTTASLTYGSLQRPISELAIPPGPISHGAVAGTSRSGFRSKTTATRSLIAGGGVALKAVTFAEGGHSNPNLGSYEAVRVDANGNHELDHHNMERDDRWMLVDDNQIGADRRMIVDENYPGTSRNPESSNNQTNGWGGEMENSSALPNPYPSDCHFCYIKLNAGDGVMLQTCLHIFCRDCLQSSIETQKELTRIPCPIADESNCGGYITDFEVKNLVSSDVYEEYLDRSVTLARKKMKYVFQCITVNCKWWAEYELGRKTFFCPSCKKIACLVCQAHHDGLECEIYQTLKNTGQLDKVDDLMEKEKRNGWSQLLEIMKAKGSTTDVQMILEQIGNLEVLENCSEFECSICMTEVDVGAGAILKECLHLFCKLCLASLIEHSDDPTIKCPHIDENYSCVCFIQEREIKNLVSPAVYDKHLERSWKLGENSMENTFHCKSPDCRGWCVYDEGVTRFDCEICGKPNCIPCNVIHEGLSCEDFRNRTVQNNNDKMSAEAVQALIDTGKAMRCPKCKIPVEKLIGCDWLQCTACKTEICWATKGPRYSFVISFYTGYK
ncbi:unnamed protein product [Orchesella dallaii]|uniref:RanBP-type and C3HC4-type zinc finger-containing protein 1 n=1 Tax=Orchesella dallaii TaxID=48710 RepID=A0ABP1RNQ8_9HEXA